jgi:Thioredoxin
LREALLVAASVFLVLPVWSFRGEEEELTKDKILATGHEWQQKYDEYQPPVDMVDALKTRLGADVRIDVYLGIWCPDSRNNVPPFIKTLDLAAGQAAVRYIGVPKKASKDLKYFVEEFQIERVPTFIVYRAGKEIGRIVENPKTGIIEDLMEIVFKEN